MACASFPRRLQSPAHLPSTPVLSHQKTTPWRRSLSATSGGISSVERCAASIHPSPVVAGDALFCWPGWPGKPDTLWRCFADHPLPAGWHARPLGSVLLPPLNHFFHLSITLLTSPHSVTLLKRLQCSLLTSSPDSAPSSEASLPCPRRSDG